MGLNQQSFEFDLILQFAPSLALGSTLPLAQRVFVFRYLRFVFHVQQQDFVPVQSLLTDSLGNVRDRLNAGIPARVCRWFSCFPM